MLEKFEPREYVSSIFDIDYEALYERGIRALMFDIDNTLMPFDVPNVPEKAADLIQALKGIGFQVFILSNGREERVRSITASLQVNGIHRAAKPLRFGLQKLAKAAGLRHSQIAIIGDQMFTDVFCANRAGSYSILVKPISLTHDEKGTIPRRKPEQKLLKRMQLTPKSLASNTVSMNVNGATKLLCVLGDPVEHTLSPAIHEIFIGKTSDNLAYVPFHVLRGKTQEALLGAKALGILGINVTIPHKEDVIPFLCGMDDNAALVGAVNTLKLTDQGYYGCNTDVYGFTRLIQRCQVPVEGSKVLILGAGGAARSAIVALSRLGAKEIVLYNRTAEKAEALVNEFSEKLSPTRKDPPHLRAIGHDDLYKESFPIVINATSCGMWPRVETLPVEPSGEDDPFYARIEYALDMVFNPEETAFIRKVKSYGHAGYGGLPMLFYQGLRSYEIWTDRTFSESEAEEMYLRFRFRAKRILAHE